MKKFLFTTLFLLVTCSVGAQTVVNPKSACFTPSPDHATISSYSLEWWNPTADVTKTSPIQSATIPIPALVPDPSTPGNFCITLSTLSVKTPAGPTYVARLVSVPADGSINAESRSAASNPFYFNLRPATNVKISWLQRLIQDWKPLGFIREFVKRSSN